MEIRTGHVEVKSELPVSPEVMEVYVYSEPEDGSSRPVQRAYTRAAAARAMRAGWPARRGEDPRTDDECVDDFVVIHWAERLEVFL